MEVGVGQAQEIIVLVPNHEGKLRITFGAVLPYYEFIQPIQQRLSDSDWQKKEKYFSIPVPVWLQPLYPINLEGIHQIITQNLQDEMKKFNNRFPCNNSKIANELNSLNNQINQVLANKDFETLSSIQEQRRQFIRKNIDIILAQRNAITLNQIKELTQAENGTKLNRRSGKKKRRK
ncbi:hypothetical protein ES708_10653 [subsurface metagenome]